MIIKNDRQELINNKLINFMLYIKYRENWQLVFHGIK
jgi:hypothetical protein